MSARGPCRPAPVLLYALLLLAPAAVASAQEGTPKVDLNTADAATLDGLPGVGPSTAAAIIAGRPYRSVADLERVKGIGPAKLAALKDRIKVDAPGNATGNTALSALIGSPAPASPPAARPTPAAASPAELINVNSADLPALVSLPGIGPSLAAAIVAGRPYRSEADLDKVKGIGPAKLAALRGRITYGGPPPGVPTPPPVTRAASSIAATPAPGPKAKSQAPAPAPPRASGRININTATPSALDTLPGIGPARAQAIIAGRPFRSVEQIKDVKGIGDVTFDKIKDRISVD